MDSDQLTVAENDGYANALADVQTWLAKRATAPEFVKLLEDFGNERQLFVDDGKPFGATPSEV